MIAESADVDETAVIGDSCRIWDLAQVREHAVIGAETVIGRGAYIDHGVRVGARCKIQNHALVYAPATLADGVFIGPAVVLTNDLYPRATDPEGNLLGAGDWEAAGVQVDRGAALGARSVVLPGVRIGEWALVGAGSVVTESVPAHALVVGVPARQIGWVGRTGRRLVREGEEWVDPHSGDRFTESSGGLVSK